MARKPPTMRDVAVRAGVSPATVSNVLGGRKRVDGALVERVRKAAADLDYQIDRVASQLRSGKTRVVSVLVPSLENPFFTSLIAALERAVRSEGYDIIIASGNDDDAVERARMAALLSWRPAGVVVLPSSDRFAARQMIEDSQVPCVVVDRVAAEHGGDAVTVDNREAAALAARHFLEIGHSRILVVASTLDLANIRERCVGIAETYRGAGLEPPEVLEVGLSFDEVGERIERRLAEDERPTGVVALTNFATMAVIAAFKRLGIAVPDEISLIGFDDYAWMRVSTPSITAIGQPIAGMAEAAWERLSARIDGDDSPPRTITLDCRLEVRQSVLSIGPPLRKLADLQRTNSL
jgi:LacI family transcriptional regulator